MQTAECGEGECDFSENINSHLKTQVREPTLESIQLFSIECFLYRPSQNYSLLHIWTTNLSGVSQKTQINDLDKIFTIRSICT